MVFLVRSLRCAACAPQLLLADLSYVFGQSFLFCI
jgi:hypothetical protein